MFKNSKKQGDAALGQAIAYFTMLGYDVALPLTDSADWDLIVEMEDGLKRIQVKSSFQLTKTGVMMFCCDVKGGNQSFSKPAKTIQSQGWDLIFLHHMVTGKQALIPKEVLITKGQINLGSTQCKYKQYYIGG
jgi:PD-(D/E)XK endonuclease